MKKLAILLVVLFAFQSQAQYDPQALKVLDAMSANYQSMETFKAEWNETLYNKAAGINEKTAQRNAIVKGKKFVIELPDLDQVLFYNGEVLHRFSPSANEVYIVEDFDPEEEFDIRIDQIYEIYKSGYKYKLDSKADFKDAEVIKIADVADADKIVNLTPEDKDASYFFMRMIISPSNLIKSIVVYSDAGNRNIYDIQSFKKVTVNDAYFSFDFKNNPNVDIID